MAMATTNESQPKEVTKIERERWLAPAGDDLLKMLKFSQGAIKSALPRHMTPERMIRVAMTAATRNPDLLQCTGVSLIAAVIQASQLGLECDGILGQAYLVPFNNKIKSKSGGQDQWRKEAMLIPGYKGLIKLARNSGELATIQDRCVYEGDDFIFSFGLNPQLEHTPREKSETITHAWASAMLKDGAKQFEVMTIKEIEAIRKRSKSADRGPWVTDFAMMCRKTVIKRLCRLLPLSIELQTALALDDRHEAGKSQMAANFQLLPEDVRESLPAPEPETDENESEAKPIMPQAKGEATAEVSDFTKVAYNRGDTLGFTSDQMNKQAMKMFKKPVAKIDSEDQIDKLLGALQASELPA